MKKSTGSTRREFLKRTAAASTALARAHVHPGRVLGRENTPAANEQVIIGVIGVGGRCNQLIDQVPAGGRDRRRWPTATCNARPTPPSERKAKWTIYQDYREMFDNEKLDAVIVATPDHARTLPCIRAVQAGLDVYAEKPLTAYVREGRVLVDARPQAQAHLPSRHAAAHDGDQPLLLRVRPRRQDRQGQEGARRELHRARDGTKACPKSRSRRRRLEHLVRPDASCGRSTTSCNSPGCSGATTPAAR